MSKKVDVKKVDLKKVNKALVVGIIIAMLTVLICVILVVIISNRKNDNNYDDLAVDPNAQSPVMPTIETAYSDCSNLATESEIITKGSKFDGIYFKADEESEFLACMTWKLGINSNILEYDDYIDFGKESTNDFTIIITKSGLNHNLEGIVFSNADNQLVVAYEGCGNLYFKPNNIQLQDDSTSLAIGSGDISWANWSYGLSCVHTAVGMPERLSKMLEGDGIFYNTDSDSWGDYSVRWYIENYLLKSEVIYKI